MMENEIIILFVEKYDRTKLPIKLSAEIVRKQADNFPILLPVVKLDNKRWVVNRQV